MTADSSRPRRLYLRRVVPLTIGSLGLPAPCYLAQTADGTNILIDSGPPPVLAPVAS